MYFIIIKCITTDLTHSKDQQKVTIKGKITKFLQS